MATVYEKLIKELCFICGCILRGTVYDVENKLLGLLPCFFEILVIENVLYILGKTRLHGIEIFTEEIIKEYIHKK